MLRGMKTHVRQYLSSSQVISLEHYIAIVQAGETFGTAAFVRELVQRVSQHGGALMTIAQQLEQKGIEKGRVEGLQLGEQRGIEKGRSEGERQATLKIARTMLQNGPCTRDCVNAFSQK